MNRKVIISQAFGSKATIYNEKAQLQKSIALKLSSFLPRLSEGSILEVGCGTGFLTKHLIQTYPDCQLRITDISSKMLAHTKSHCPKHANICFQKLDGEQPNDLSGRKFDLIVSSMVIQWFHDPKRALENYQPYLKPSGSILYATLAPNSFPEWEHSLAALSLKSGMINIPRLAGEFLKETHKMQYPTTFTFLKQLKLLGTHTPEENYTPLSPGQLLRACKNTDEQYDSQISWLITYGKLIAHSAAKT